MASSGNEGMMTDKKRKQSKTLKGREDGPGLFQTQTARRGPEREPKKKESGDSHQSVTVPDFQRLLNSPLVKEPVADFDIAREASALNQLWQDCPALRNYRIREYVSAGGSGMVFRAEDVSQQGQMWALKIAREKLLSTAPSSKVSVSLSPIAENELMALQALSHQNVVRLKEAIRLNNRIVAIVTSYIDKPSSIDKFVASTFEKKPLAGDIQPFSPIRLDKACDFLAQKLLQLASALQHMHAQGIVHFDLKPANVLVSAGDNSVTITDLGACVHINSLASATELRVQFTWTYAHPELRDLTSEPKGVSGGGLKASASVKATDQLTRFDLYAFGKTMQEILAVIEGEFGERAHGSYGFRFLHLIACLLLDGQNAAGGGASSGKLVDVKDGRRFLSDVASGCPSSLFAQHKIRSAVDLVDRLERYDRNYSFSSSVPELDRANADIINCVVNAPAPWTKRVKAIFDHPSMRRLKNELQLGFIRDVYPGATHDRWTHSLGVFSASVNYYNAILSDPDVPLYRVLANRDDIQHGLIAAIVHDIAQTSFGHDLEEVSEQVFAHDKLVAELLSAKLDNEPTLKATIRSNWPGFDEARLLRILRAKGQGWEETPADPKVNGAYGGDTAIDGVASDIINGAIDADKFDYLIRDSVYCGVTYGHGIDSWRFQQALTTAAESATGGKARICLAYKAKGRPAIESLIIARYQMYNSVYWHHTFRCVKAMFVHAAAMAWNDIAGGAKQWQTDESAFVGFVREAFLQIVVLGKPWAAMSNQKSRPQLKLSGLLSVSVPPEVANDAALEFVYRFSEGDGRKLVEAIASRRLFKRVFEVRLGELGKRGNYAELKSLFVPSDRPRMAREIQSRLLKKVDQTIRATGPRGSTSVENAAIQRLNELMRSSDILLVLDFPMRGIPKERNLPIEVPDAVRKYSSLARTSSSASDSLFYAAKTLLEQSACFRVFADPRLHELIVRYLTVDDVRSCVEEVFPSVSLESP